MKVVKIFRMPDVSGVTGLKSSTIYKLVRTKEFPPPIKLTSRSSGWLSHDVDRWLESRLTNQRVLQRSETEQLAADASPILVAGEVSIANLAKNPDGGSAK